MRIVVTGGAGFIGSNVAGRLSDSGHELRILDDLSTGLPSNLEGVDCELVVGDLADRDVVQDVVRNADAVVHLGARGSVPRSVAHPVRTHEVNATGTLNVLEAARDTGAHVVFSSSSSVYGANDALPKHEHMWLSPLSPYAASKLSAEGYCSAFANSYELPVTVLRFFNVFGPNQRPDHDYAAVIPKWIWAALHDQPLEVHGDGSQTRDFTYVATVVDVIQQAVERRVLSPQPTNLAFGNRISLLELLAGIKGLVGREVRVTHSPQRPADVAHSQNDPKRLRATFPDVSPMPFDDALRSTYRWLESRSRTVAG